MVKIILVKVKKYTFNDNTNRKEMKKFIKKEIEGCKKFFVSKSYSFNYGIYAYSKKRISIDIEKKRILSNTHQQALINFSFNEKDMVLMQRGISLIQIWTIKESYSKFYNKGLKLDFKKIYISWLKNDLFNVKHPDFDQIKAKILTTTDTIISISSNEECVIKFETLKGVM
ncbi:4'-phosphopantetheinyl transferase superfamily protein [Rummeliibacillus pycnus]|uniref:4'-phosphopantetheinyl transferase superfamily protein n=1 Tax=Rummeliibacillus pycnus TaxID=101070 RepID=UPI003D290C3A